MTWESGINYPHPHVSPAVLLGFAAQLGPEALLAARKALAADVLARGLCEWAQALRYISGGDWSWGFLWNWDHIVAVHGAGVSLIDQAYQIATQEIGS